MAIFIILIGILTLRFVYCKTRMPHYSEPPPRIVSKATSYGYGNHTFHANSTKEAEQIMASFDRADKRDKIEEALKKFNWCHILDARRKCSLCGIDRYSPEWETRCPQSSYEICVEHYGLNP